MHTYYMLSVIYVIYKGTWLVFKAIIVQAHEHIQDHFVNFVLEALPAS